MTSRVHVSPSSGVAHELDAEIAVAWLCRNGLWVKLELVCSWCWLLGYAITSAGLNCSWSAVGADCLVKLELVCSWCWLLRHPLVISARKV